MKKPTDQRAGGEAEEAKTPPPADGGEGMKTVQEPAVKTPWVLGTWQGMPQHRCPVCQWDTLDGEEAMAQRMIACQRPDCPMPPAPPAATGHVLVADKHGKPKEQQ